MRFPGTVRALTAVGACLILWGCGGSRTDVNLVGAELMGVYRGRIERDGERSRKFRLLLFSALPDRLHAEIVSPVGSTEMILDGGGGRLAVTLVREKISFVGEADSTAMNRVLGVRLGVAELVRGILTDEPPKRSDVSLHRIESDSPPLPRTVEIESGASRLFLELKRVRAVKFRSSGIGTGNPPEGIEDLRPLDELELEGMPPGSVAEE